MLRRRRETLDNLLEKQTRLKYKFEKEPAYEMYHFLRSRISFPAIQ